MAGDNTARSPEEQIRRTIAEIAQCTDRGDFDCWVNLFVEDGSFHMLGQSHQGHAALRAFIEDDQPPERRGLHLTTDSVIDIDGDRARVSSNFIFIASGEASPMVVAGGRYLDVLVPRGDRWLFLERETVLFGPTAMGNWGPRNNAEPGKVPWYAVTRATPPELHGSFPAAPQGS
jgi:3-phenylpropionate/cinnamic acid dioxygenase small subunit